MPLDRDLAFRAVRPGADHQVRVPVLLRRQAVGGQVLAVDLQHPVGTPGERRRRGQGGPFEEHQVARAVAVDHDLAVALPGLQPVGHAVVAVRRVLGHDRVDGHLAALHVEGRLPAVAAHAPGLRDVRVGVGVGPEGGHQGAQRKPGREGAPAVAARGEVDLAVVLPRAAQAGDAQLAPLGHARAEVHAAQLQLVADDAVRGDPAAHDLDPELQFALEEEREDAGVLVDVAVRGVGRGPGPAAVDAPVPEQPAAEDAGGHVPGPLDPLPLALETGRVDPGLEAGPVVAVTILVGVFGGLGRVGGLGRGDHHAALLLVPQGDRLHRHVPLVHVDEAHVRGPRQGQQVAVGAPAGAAERAVQGEFLVEPERLLVEPDAAVAEVGVLQVAVEPALHGHRAAAALELDDLQELGQPPLAHQEPLDPGVGGQFVDDGEVGLVEELVGPLHERLAVLVVRVRQHLEVQHQVGLQAGRVVLALALLVLPRAPVREEAADRLHRRDPVAQVGQFGVALGDGRRGPAFAPAPEVDDVGDHVDLGGPEVGVHVDPGVLVHDALGERDVVVVPEGPPEHLVPDRPVVDQRLEPGDVGAAPVLLHRALVQRRLPLLRGVHHLHVARHEVRVGPLQGAHQKAVGVLGDDVVAVHEGEELALGVHGPQPGVARVPGAVRLLADQAEPRVGRAEVGGDA